MVIVFLSHIMVPARPTRGRADVEWALKGKSVQQERNTYEEKANKKTN